MLTRSNFTLPNAVSLSRLLATPLIVWLWLTGQFKTSFFIFLIAALSDVADGALTRIRTKSTLLQRTLTGKILDPVADRILIATLAVIILTVWLPLWLIFVYLAMEAGLIGYLIWWQITHKLAPEELMAIIESNIAGKTRMAAASITILVAMAAVKYKWLEPLVYMGFALTIILLAIAIGLYIIRIKIEEYYLLQQEERRRSE